MRSLLSAAAILLFAGSLGAQEAEQAGANPQMVLETTEGTIVIELFQNEAPKSVANIIQYVEDGFYDGTIFHRVIDNFMIQGGGFEQGMVRKATREPIQNEADNGLKNTRGTVALARTADPHSATAQFYINTVNNRSLNHQSKTAEGWGYAVFGQVIEDGMKVADRISRTRTQTFNGVPNVPALPIVIERAYMRDPAASPE